MSKEISIVGMEENPDPRAAAQEQKSRGSLEGPQSLTGAALFSGRRSGMFSFLPSAKSLCIIHALPNIVFASIIDFPAGDCKDQKSGSIRYRTKRGALFGEEAWIADRERAGRPSFGPSQSC